MKLTRNDHQSTTHHLDISTEEILALLAKELGINLPGKVSVWANSIGGDVGSLHIQWQDARQETAEVPIAYRGKESVEG